jgi:sulfur-oxidizing protein SoxY
MPEPSPIKPTRAASRARGPSGQSRRGFLAATAGAGLAFVVRPAKATPTSMAVAIRNVVGDAKPQQGKVKLNLPPLVENGNTVAVGVSVESPMTPENHVKAIHLFADKNPLPNVISATFGPRAGKAEVSTRMRLADTQTVVAICEMSDGSFWSDSVDVVITFGACLED